jgi:hypothetical protein
MSQRSEPFADSAMTGTFDRLLSYATKATPVVAGITNAVKGNPNDGSAPKAEVQQAYDKASVASQPAPTTPTKPKLDPTLIVVVAAAAVLAVLAFRN